MIQFADNEQLYLVSATGYESERAELYIAQNNVILNPKAPLIATVDLYGKFVFELSSFFRYAKNLQTALPSLTEIEPLKTFPQAIQDFKIITKVKGNEIENETISIIWGASSYDFLSRYSNRFLSNLPTTLEAYEDEPIYQYTYLTRIINGLNICGTIRYDNGTVQDYVIRYANTAENNILYRIDFGLNTIASALNPALTVRSYTMLLCDRDNVTRISSVMNIIIRKTPNYHPFQLMYRNKLGVWQSIIMTEMTNKSEASKLKGNFTGNVERHIYSEYRDKVTVTTGVIRTSLAYALRTDLCHTNEVYLVRGASYIPLLIDSSNLPAIDLEAPNQAITIEFMYAKIKSNYA
jgi:hypothetical protein